MTEDEKTAILDALQRSGDDPEAVSDREALHDFQISPEALAELVRPHLPGGTESNDEADAFWQIFVGSIGPDYHGCLDILGRLLSFKVWQAKLSA